MSAVPLVSSAEADESLEVAGESSAVVPLFLRRVFSGGRGGAAAAASCKKIPEATPRGDMSRVSKSVQESYGSSICYYICFVSDTRTQYVTRTLGSPRGRRKVD